MGRRKKRKNDIWRKSHGRCAHCGEYTPIGSQTVDHYVPVSMGGGSDRRNLMPLCRRCNVRRQNFMIAPYDFYHYADEMAVNACVEYHKEWQKMGESAAGLRYRTWGME